MTATDTQNHFGLRQCKFYSRRSDSCGSASCRRNVKQILMMTTATPNDQSSPETFSRNLNWMRSRELSTCHRTHRQTALELWFRGNVVQAITSCTHALLIFTVARSPFGLFQTTISALHHLHETLSFRMFIFIIPPSLHVPDYRYVAQLPPPSSAGTGSPPVPQKINRKTLFNRSVDKFTGQKQFRFLPPFLSCIFISTPTTGNQSYLFRFKVNRSEAQLNQYDAIKRKTKCSESVLPWTTSQFRLLFIYCVVATERGCQNLRTCHQTISNYEQ